MRLSFGAGASGAIRPDHLIDEQEDSMNFLSGNKDAIAWAAFMATVLLSGCTVDSRQRASDCPEFIDISMYAVLADPWQFHGCRIAVKGYVRLEFEGTKIYADQADFSHGLSKNGLWLDFFGSDRDEMEVGEGVDGNYAIVVGVIDAAHTGHMGLSTAAITDIERIEHWSDPERPRRLSE